MATKQALVLVLRLAGLLLAAGCAPRQQAPLPAEPATPGIRVRSDCIVERHVYGEDGHRLVVWVMRPLGEGPFPLIVWNHGSRIGPRSWFDTDRTQEGTIGYDHPCREGVTRYHWMYAYPEGRGYGGSDGPFLAPRLSDTRAVIEYLHGRADDANEAARLLRLRPDVRRDCTVIGGESHGGVTTLFAAADAPELYRAAIVQATGICYSKPCGLDALETAASEIKAPLLIQHFASDTRVPASISRAVAHWAALRNPHVTYKEYPGVKSEEGHEINAPGNYSQWIDDYREAVKSAFAACPS